jgi:hypothetical protein
VQRGQRARRMPWARGLASGLAALLWLGFAGCDDEGGAQADAAGGAGGAGGQGGAGGVGGAGGQGGAGGEIPMDQPELRFVDGNSEVFESNAGEVPWLWGFQGGTMIRPVLVMPESAQLTEGDFIEVVFEHAADPAAPEAFTLEPGFERVSAVGEVVRQGEELWVGPLNDQIGWSGLEGIRLTVSAEVLTTGHRVSQAITLVKDTVAEAHACFPWAPGLGTGSCQYAQMPGTLTLDEVGEGETTIACGDPSLRLHGRFDPGPQSVPCLERTGFSEQVLLADIEVQEVRLSPACAAARGLVPGAQVQVIATFQVEGTCSPGPDFTLASDDPEQPFGGPCGCP